MKQESDEPRQMIPAGWVQQSHLDTFSGHAGPFWFRPAGASPGVGFWSEARHLNAGGVIHGGALLTLADMSLWDILIRAAGPFRGVTVTLNAEFVGPGEAGVFVEATGEAVKIGRSLMFARGLATANGSTILSFSGSLKRLR